MKKIIATLLIVTLFMAIPVIHSESAKAKANNKKAKKAFYEWMSQDSIPWGSGSQSFAKKSYRFKYMEMGKKKIPILIVYTNDPEKVHAEGYWGVLQYIKGKVKWMVSEDGIDFLPKSGMLMTTHSGGGGGSKQLSEHIYYKIDSTGVLRECARVTKYLEATVYEIGDEYNYVSEANFNKWLEKNTNGEKYKSWKSYKNTARNRKKYLYPGRTKK